MPINTNNLTSSSIVKGFFASGLVAFSLYRIYKNSNKSNPPKKQAVKNKDNVHFNKSFFPEDKMPSDAKLLKIEKLTNGNITNLKRIPTYPVYKGNLLHNKDVVVKVCSKSEAGIYKRLSKYYPLFPKVFNIKEDSSSAIVVMEDIKGLSLQVGKLDDNQIIKLIESCWIMATEGVLHKDFGCNTFIAPNRPIVILDFGVVKERATNDHIIEDFQEMLFNRRHKLGAGVYDKIKSAASFKEALSFIDCPSNNDGCRSFETTKLA